MSQSRNDGHLGAPVRFPDGSTAPSIAEAARRIGCRHSAIYRHIIDQAGGYVVLGSVPSPDRIGRRGSVSPATDADILAAVKALGPVPPRGGSLFWRRVGEHVGASPGSVRTRWYRLRKEPTS